MTNQVNQAFEKWFGETYNDLQFNKAGMIDAWKAATQAHESEINSLKQRVEELEKDRNEWYKDSQDRRLRIIELTASNNQLREALEACKYDCHTGEVILIAEKALSSTPAQSLAGHDNEVIDRCKNIVADDALAITFQSMGAYRSAIIKQIGELKVTP